MARVGRAPARSGTARPSKCEAGRDGQDTARRMRAETESDFDDERKEPIRGAKEGRSPEREAHSRAAPDR